MFSIFFVAILAVVVAMLLYPLLKNGAGADETDLGTPGNFRGRARNDDDAASDANGLRGNRPWR